MASPARLENPAQQWRVCWSMLWLAPLIGTAMACASVDPGVLDARLRKATFRAYVGAIEAQFGGLEAAGVTPDELRERYCARATQAESPAAFYRVLSEMLADLDDPHAALRVSPRFWQAPVAEPEWTQFVRSRGQVWVGMPTRSIRSPEHLARAVSLWMEPLGASAMSELEPLDVARFLRSSAAYTGSRGNAGIRSPLEWFRLRAIDGVVVESPHDAELLVRGALGSTVEFLVGGVDSKATLALLRNAGVFEAQMGPRGLRRRLSSLELAETLEEKFRLGEPPRLPSAIGRVPTSANRARRSESRRSAFRLGHQFELGLPEAAAFGVEAWRIRTPQGRSVAYLRIARFEPRVPGDTTGAQSTALGPTETEDGVQPRLDTTLMAAFRSLDVRGWNPDQDRGVDALIVDVVGNAGGSWVETGLLLSYFLPPNVQVVPHSVDTVRDTGPFFFRTRTRSKQLLGRAEVPHLRPKQLFVLVDQSTASAGEITAATLRGVAGATLVGERTAGAEYSTAEFVAPDGSTLRIGLSGGMEAPLPSFQGRGLIPDILIEPRAAKDEAIDLEAWRARFRFLALREALATIDSRATL